MTPVKIRSKTAGTTAWPAVRSNTSAAPKIRSRWTTVQRRPAFESVIPPFRHTSPAHTDILSAPTSYHHHEPNLLPRLCTVSPRHRSLPCVFRPLTSRSAPQLLNILHTVLYVKHVKTPTPRTEDGTTRCPKGGKNASAILRALSHIYTNLLAVLLYIVIVIALRRNPHSEILALIYSTISTADHIYNHHNDQSTYSSMLASSRSLTRSSSHTIQAQLSQRPSVRLSTRSSSFMIRERQNLIPPYACLTCNATDSPPHTRRSYATMPPLQNKAKSMHASPLPICSAIRSVEVKPRISPPQKAPYSAGGSR